MALMQAPSRRTRRELPCGGHAAKQRDEIRVAFKSCVARVKRANKKIGVRGIVFSYGRALMSTRLSNRYRIQPVNGKRDSHFLDDRLAGPEKPTLRSAVRDF